MKGLLVWIGDINMQCDVCGRTNGHLSGCPLERLENKYKGIHYCSICGYGIIEYERYIENNGEYVHYECIPGIRWLAEWAGLRVEKMRANDE